VSEEERAEGEHEECAGEDGEGCKTTSRILEEVYKAGTVPRPADFNHVIDSLWPTDDDVCVEIARGFYNALNTALAASAPRQQNAPPHMRAPPAT